MENKQWCDLNDKMVIDGTITEFRIHEHWLIRHCCSRTWLLNAMPSKIERHNCNDAAECKDICIQILHCVTFLGRLIRTLAHESMTANCVCNRMHKMCLNPFRKGNSFPLEVGKRISTTAIFNYTAEWNVLTPNSICVIDQQGQWDTTENSLFNEFSEYFYHCNYNSFRPILNEHHQQHYRILRSGVPLSVTLSTEMYKAWCKR